MKHEQTSQVCLNVGGGAPDVNRKEMADFWQQVVAQRTQELYEVRKNACSWWQGRWRNKNRQMDFICVFQA